LDTLDSPEYIQLVEYQNPASTLQT
jgi:hypothetical protein